MMVALASVEKNLVRTIDVLRGSLVVANEEKPWCEVVEASKLPNVYAKYRQLKSREILIGDTLHRHWEA